MIVIAYAIYITAQTKRANSQKKASIQTRRKRMKNKTQRSLCVAQAQQFTSRTIYENINKSIL